MRAFFDPKSFMASLLSVGANRFWSWLFTHPELLVSLDTEFLQKASYSVVQP